MSAKNRDGGLLDIARLAQGAMDRAVASTAPLQGGMVGEVYRIDFADGGQAVAKIDRRTQPMLAVEGMMLRYLAQQSALPVPAVYHAEPALLIMNYLPGTSDLDGAAEGHAGALIADLHSVQREECGFGEDTLIGLYTQPNVWSVSWPAFFAEYRLLHLARLALDLARMSPGLCARIERLCARIDTLIDNPARASLVHGDIWRANLLAENGRITGVLDPALYYGHPEVELAYIFLFDSMGDAFLRGYQERRPIQPGFFEERMGVYQLYPLLSHVCHFGGKYVQMTEEWLDRLGF